MSTNQKTPGLPCLLIVDGHSFAYRAFYAIRQLNAPDGRPTNAIYGFIRMLGKVRSFVKPTHIVVVWDGGLAPERMALLPEYKAQRKETPADLKSQLDPIVAFLKASNITSWMQPGVEADDGIATLTHQAASSRIQVVIASSDKDFMQLVSETTRLLGPSATAESVLDIQGVMNKTGVKPEQIIDWLSLLGDTVDNIPGVEGIGLKSATKLLQQFGSIDELYRRLPEVESARLRGSLCAAGEAVRRNQKMVRLNAQVPCALTMEGLAVRGEDTEGLRELYKSWGFQTLMRELDAERLKTENFFSE